MKYGLFTLLIIGTSVYAMDGQLQLTAQEQSCYNWFVERQKTLPSTMKKLTPEDQEVFNKQIKFSDDPHAVIRSRHNFAEAFYTLAQEENPESPLPHDKEFVKTTFVKMAKMLQNTEGKEPTDLLTTRIWAWGKLSDEDKKAYSADVYGNNPDATMAAVTKWSDVACKKLVELKLLSVEDIPNKQQEFKDEAKARFEKQYKDK